MPVYEGTIEDISSQQLNYLTSVLEKRGFGESKVTVAPVGKAGDNYGANVKRVVAEKEDKCFKMVIKIASTIDYVRKGSNVASMFFNEYTMYAEVLPKFRELEIAAGIPEDDRLRYAEFYGGYLEEPYELILLEDLQEPGFVMLDRFKSLDNDTVKLILKSFARLHALSFALKTKEPETFEEFKRKLRSPWEVISEDENNKIFFKGLEDDAFALLESESHKKVISGKVSQFSEQLLKLQKVDYDSRYSVIQQGDSWTNNIMFRMQDDKPLQCCMIDYQLSRVNSPVADLQYMIFNCTDHEMRSQHFQDWIDYYYMRLDKELSEFGLKADYCYPRDQLDADMKRHANLSLGLAVMLASVLTRQAADAAKLMKAIELQEDIKDIIQTNRITELDPVTKNLFKTRVAGTIDTMFEMGLL